VVPKRDAEAGSCKEEQEKSDLKQVKAEVPDVGRGSGQGHQQGAAQEEGIPPNNRETKG
jgi:hypothetical protein